jgi:uncharacterized membrane protein YraQ (UPF0718 family)
MNLILFYSLNIFYKSYSILLQLLPYLAAGTLISEYLKYVKLHRLVEKLRMKGNPVSVFFASLVGMASPLCTFGTVPVVVRLMDSGLPARVLVVFLISSSMMNPQLFVMTWGGISLKMAVARIVTIMVFSLLTGCLLSVLPKEWVLNKRSLDGANKGQSEAARPVRESFKWKSYFVNVIGSLEFTGFYIVIGVLLVPADVTDMLFQQDKILQMLVAAALSIPFYTCGGGAIPVVRSLISGGMSSGTALAFLNVGSATRVTTLMALAAIIRPAAIFAYVILLVMFSILAGYFFV